ncbi:FAD:protein FMN transferase [Halioxenophilus sp. WMMB6]|uniref:FAD:protein FMN transferase n=1 Tax=Halioxenophilus sp. WMMB6 TaxID=3073815 RepID=UPI00295E3A37|nr:FAD:protein FMN transferase [Halioxenophilus sp. WMMB6]
MPSNGSSSRRLLLVTAACLSLWLALPARAEWFQQNWAIMGTEVGARIWWQDADQAAQLLALVRAEMERIDTVYSPYIDSSELARVNQLAASQTQTLSPEFARLVDKALWVNRISHGAFDITYASVGHLYDYRSGQAPDDAQIAANLPAVGKLHWQPHTRQIRFAHPGVKIDLGGLAKGYAVDSAAALLREHGVQHASVNAGGDTRLLGDNLGRPWLIGIKNPRPGPDDAAWQSVVKLPMANEAISTSGDYERYFIDQHTGERVHHILNPATGKSSHGLISASVIGPEGFNTDPLATAVFVMGAEAGLAMINQLPGYEAIVITSSGEIRYSSGLTPPELQ